MSTSYAKCLSSICRSALLFNLIKWRHRKRFARVDTPEVKRHLHELKVNGYSIVENFFSPEECAVLRDDLDRAIQRYPEAIWTGHAGADKRIFGIEHLGGDFLRFFDDDFARQVGARYFGGRLDNLQTLAGRIDAVEGNIGSGDGWHRDGYHFQFKSLLYLSDANPENGPFQLIRDSHRFSQVPVDSHAMGLEEPLKTRYSEKQVNTLIAAQPDRLVTLTAPAGTMVLLDTSTIHRGSPIQSGRRYAMFNYYYPSYDIPGRKEKFTPRLRPEMLAP